MKTRFSHIGATYLIQPPLPFMHELGFHVLKKMLLFTDGKYYITPQSYGDLLRDIQVNNEWNIDVAPFLAEHSVFTWESLPT